MKNNISNRNWILILTFFGFFTVFTVIGYELFHIQYNDEDIVLTHNPTIRKIDAPRGNILSEDGRILSVTMPLYEVRVDLFTIDTELFEKEVSNLSLEIHKMFPTISADEYENLLRKNKNKDIFC